MSQYGQSADSQASQAGARRNREEFLTRYHKRSNCESAFSMIKAKFGPVVRSKSRTGQVNEVLAKVLCHNICVLILAMHEIGLDMSQTGICTQSLTPAQKLCA
jgi:hypothetical protein